MEFLEEMSLFADGHHFFRSGYIAFYFQKKSKFLVLPKALRLSERQLSCK